MKKNLYFILMVFCLMSCSEDLTEYYTREDEIEAANKKQEEENKKLEEANKKLKEQAQRLQNSLDSLAKIYESGSFSTELVAMGFSSAENPTLTEDLLCEISSDGTVECWIPEITTEKNLIPRFSFHGSEVTINGQKASSGTGKYDFTNPVKLTVKGSDKTIEYTVYVHSFTGLPIMRIDTEGGKEVTSKTEYINAHMTLSEDVLTRAPSDVVEGDLKIRGRGNSTWGLPKKPYRLKFNEKISLLGEHKDKDWVLVANYPDKSMIRNDLAMAMGKMSKLEWTPACHYVELIFNGRYDGTYLLFEKIEASNDKVAVGDDGFVLQVDAHAESDSSAVYFYSNYIDYSIEIKEPDVTWGDSNYQYISDFIDTAENVLFSDIFKDPKEGWQKYMDIDSFVDWYLIHEMSKNEDSMFHFSCHMNLKRGGKLKMGPIWDFDIAFGNVKEKETTAMFTDGFMLEWSQWYTRLMQDPAFLSKLRERFIYFYNHKDELISYINTDAQYLKHAAQENQNRWGTFYHYSYKQYDIWGSYQNEVQSLKEWLNNRMEWMKKAYNI